MQTPQRKEQIQGELTRVRAKTLRLMAQVPDAFWNVRVHDFYSPIGWHFGHIGMTEEHWTWQRAMGRPPQDADLCFLFANIPENPKDNRVHLPDRAEVEEYLCTTRRRALAALDDATLDDEEPLRQDGYAWEFALQHECQHQETICELLQLIRQRLLPETVRLSSETQRDGTPLVQSEARRSPGALRMVSIPGGRFMMGSDDLHGYDNEKQAHPVEVAPFELALLPVSVADWLEFMAAGGYERPDHWSQAGWAWRVQYDISCPEYWHRSPGGHVCCTADGVTPLSPNAPVTSLSWYEADAYARWAGLRLPTEAEWEFAAVFDPTTGRARRFPWGDDPAGSDHVDCEIRSFKPRPLGELGQATALGVRDMAGGVWEWTSSPFLPYPGYRAFPYDGYSLEHMDGNHRVCRGGSWATDRRILRGSFRNWYVPTYRQGFLGMRCAR